ncbi:MAG TPA: hypothetical protein VNA25_12875, partial [Phycisphaerae bacterium]|nr:hypothetical protein [Phycisphaerae bacterium]
MSARAWRTFEILLALVCMLSWTGRKAEAEDLVLNDVPTYYWYHGCSPTSGMMVFGYWDAYGYGNLIPGSKSWATNEAAIKNAIASSEHIADYALYGLAPSTYVNGNGLAWGDPAEDYGASSPCLDLSSISPGSAHPDDCLADFMGTSRSSLGLNHGATGVDAVSTGMGNYATYRGYSFDVDAASLSWDVLTTEIQSGRPVL